MNWDAISAFAELTAALGVIITLIYLAIQIRENSRQIRIGAIASINQLINEGFDPVYNSEYNTRVWLEGLSRPDAQEEMEKQLFNLFMARMMNTFQTSLVQYQHQTLGEIDFQRYSGFFKGILETLGGRQWFETVGVDMMSEEGIEMLVSKTNVSFPWFLSTHQSEKKTPDNE